jgi:HK97 family phage major capsid protein
VSIYLKGGQFMYKRLKEIESRKTEIRGLIESGEELDAQAISEELETLGLEERGLLDKIELLQKAQSGQIPDLKPVEERTFTGHGGLSPAEYQMYEARKSKDYRHAFFKMLQCGKGSLTTEERGILQSGNAIGNGRNLAELRFTSDTSSAGAAIPQITLDTVIQKMLITSAVYPFISKYNLKGNLKVPYENVFGDAAWTAEGTAVDPGNDSLGGLLLSAYDLIKTVKVSRVVEQLSVDAFEAYIVDKLFRKIMVSIENAVLNGSGSTSNQPTGILNAISWGSSNSLAYGKDLTKLTYDTFTALKAKLLAPYHPGSYWVMSSNTLYSGVCAIKDALGRPIFLENPQWGLTTDSNGGNQTDYSKSAIVGRILGNPVIMSPYIPDGSILFGDLRFYHFNLSVDVLIEKSYEYGFASNDVWYKGWLLADGGVSQQEAFVLGQLG